MRAAQKGGQNATKIAQRRTERGQTEQQNGRQTGDKKIEQREKAAAKRRERYRREAK